MRFCKEKGEGQSQENMAEMELQKLFKDLEKVEAVVLF